MTAGSELESHLIGGEPEVPVEEGKAVVSKSPTQLALGRFRKDKLSMISFMIVALYFLAAIAAPILVKTGVLDPYTYHRDLLDVNTLPVGKWGGISGDHPLGVEPGTGRDVMSRVWYGVTFSLLISISATIIAVILGVVRASCRGPPAAGSTPSSAGSSTSPWPSPRP